jgi:hypothetical protein
MSAADAAAEPTMEEILASIRRIISEDEAPAAGDAPEEDVLDLAQAEPVTDDSHVSADFDFDSLPVDDPVPAPAPVFDEVDDLMVMEDLPPAMPEPVAAAPVYTPPPQPAPVYATAPAPAPALAPAPAPAPAVDYGLLSDQAANAAASAFARVNPGLPGVFASGSTVEGLVAHLLQPMLKEWLDTHLPRIVEEKVEAELARVSRRF